MCRRRATVVGRRPRSYAESLSRRADQPGGVSDADADVVGLQAMQGGLVDEIPAGHHTILRTDRPLTEALDDLAALLDARLARLDP